jgi:2-oxoglutarate ferredoxin oxidoreductase subunit gamma
MMERAAIIGGFGGQGILFAGQVLAQAALDEDLHVTWLPSYGPEMRGGTASCTVVVADHPIGSPIVDVADLLIALTPPALARYEALVAEDGLIVLNSSLIEAESRDGVEAVGVRCSEIARAAGDDRVVGVVALGAAIARRPIVAAASIREALRAVSAKAGPDAVERNVRAFEAGLATPEAASV